MFNVLSLQDININTSGQTVLAVRVTVKDICGTDMMNVEEVPNNERQMREEIVGASLRFNILNQSQRGELRIFSLRQIMK